MKVRERLCTKKIITHWSNLMIFHAHIRMDGSDSAALLYSGGGKCVEERICSFWRYSFPYYEREREHNDYCTQWKALKHCFSTPHFLIPTWWYSMHTFEWMDQILLLFCILEVANVLKRGYVVFEGTASHTQLCCLARAHQCKCSFCVSVVETQRGATTWLLYVCVCCGHSGGSLASRRRWVLTHVQNFASVIFGSPAYKESKIWIYCATLAVYYI